MEPCPSTTTRSAPSHAPSITYSNSPAIKSAITASTATPDPPKRIPVCPVPMKLTFFPRVRKRWVISQAVVIFPESQSVPTTSSTGTFRSFHVPFGKCGGFGGLRRSVRRTSLFLALSLISSSSFRNTCIPLIISHPSSMAISISFLVSSFMTPPGGANPMTIVSG